MFSYERLIVVGEKKLINFGKIEKVGEIEGKRPSKTQPYIIDRKLKYSNCLETNKIEYLSKVNLIN